MIQISFYEKSNKGLEGFIDLCTVSTDSKPKVLVVKPLEELAQEQPKVINLAKEEEEEVSLTLSKRIKAHTFSSSRRNVNNFIVAVDSGILNLGRLAGGGVVFAIRGAAVCNVGKALLVIRYGTGGLILTPQNRATVFRYIGKQLNKPDLYVEEINGKLVPRPGVIDTEGRMLDRCRNFVERMIQEDALEILATNGGGLLLIDGSLTISYDTPTAYLRNLLETGRNNAVDICGVSKRSRIVIGEMPIESLFDAYPTFVGYAPLLSVLEAEKTAYEWSGKGRRLDQVTTGTELFAARFGFGPPGITFRVDVSKSFGSTDTEIINDVYNKCAIYGGYPRPLIDAHQYSAFTSSEAMSILADSVVQHNLVIKEEPSLNVLFQPFGAFGK